MTKRTISADEMRETAKRSGVIRALLDSATTMTAHNGITPAGMAACYLTAAVFLLSDKKLVNPVDAELLMREAAQLFALNTAETSRPN